jgi:hypothetical protein
MGQARFLAPKPPLAPIRNAVRVGSCEIAGASQTALGPIY